jgi:hypothetical protein
MFAQHLRLCAVPVAYTAVSGALPPVDAPAASDFVSRMVLCARWIVAHFALQLRFSTGTWHSPRLFARRRCGRSIRRNTRQASRRLKRPLTTLAFKCWRTGSRTGQGSQGASSRSPRWFRPNRAGPDRADALFDRSDSLPLAGAPKLEDLRPHGRAFEPALPTTPLTELAKLLDLTWIAAVCRNLRFFDFVTDEASISLLSLRRQRSGAVPLAGSCAGLPCAESLSDHATAVVNRITVQVDNRTGRPPLDCAETCVRAA